MINLNATTVIEVILYGFIAIFGIISIYGVFKLTRPFSDQ